MATSTKTTKAKAPAKAKAKAPAAVAGFAHVPAVYPHGVGSIRPSYTFAAFLALGMVKVTQAGRMDKGAAVPAKGPASKVLSPISRAWQAKGRIEVKDGKAALTVAGLNELQARQEKGHHVPEHVAAFAKGFKQGGIVETGGQKFNFAPIK